MQVTDNINVIYCLFKRALQFSAVNNNHEIYEIKHKKIFTKGSSFIWLYVQFLFSYVFGKELFFNELVHSDRFLVIQTHSLWKNLKNIDITLKKKFKEYD